jgi:hypothetical protein
VDVFSFGVFMWELMTGREPHHELTYEEIVGKLSGLKDDVPGDMKYLWTLAKASDPVSHHQLRLHIKRNVAFS